MNLLTLSAFDSHADRVFPGFGRGFSLHGPIVKKFGRFALSTALNIVEGA